METGKGSQEGGIMGKDWGRNMLDPVQELKGSFFMGVIFKFWTFSFFSGFSLAFG